MFSDQDMSQARRKFQLLDQQITRDAVTRMRSGSGSVLGSIMSVVTPRQIPGTPSPSESGRTGFLGRLAGAGGGSGGGAAGGLFGRLAGGIGPGILGLGARSAGILGLGGSLLGALPAAGALGAGLGVIGAGAGVLFSGKNNPLAKQAKDALDSAKSVIQQAAQPLVAPLLSAFRQLAPFLRSIAPELHSLFAGAAPLIRPLLTGLESLVRGLLPGLVSILHAAQPAFAVFAQVLGTLGKDLGGLFTAFAPVIRQSSVIFKALFDVIGALLPIVGKLAAVFARTLAPVFPILAGLVRQLEPTLAIIGRILASLASAILGDLVSAFRALVVLVSGITPSLNVLARVLGQVFTTLENSGAFAILGNALEQLAKPLAALISALIRGLVPVLPSVIRLVTDLATGATAILVRSLVDLINPLTWLINKMPALVPITLGVIAAIKAWRVAQVLLDAVLSANPIGLVILAVGALVVAIVELVKHWKTVWGEIKRLAGDAWNFIYNGFGKYLLPLLGPAGLIALGAIELARHWQTVMSAIQTAARDLWHYLWDDFGAKIVNFFTHTIPSALDIWLNSVKIVWDGIEIAFLKGAAYITNVMGKLPGPLGAPFRQAHADIAQQLAGIEQNVARSAARINQDWQNIHGRHVALTFGLNLPAGVSYPSRPIKGHRAAGGGVGSAGVYLVGEKGPELTWLPAGAHVMAAKPTAKILGGLAGGTGWNLADAFQPGVGQFLGQLNSAAAAAMSAIVAAVRRSATLSFAPTGGIGSGVQRWGPLVLRVLAMLGQPAADLGTVLSQMTTESGGNPLAINLTDSNAAAGDPSRGLMQVIGSTFAAYAGPFRGLGIYNPLANIYAGLNYALHRYGAGWTSVLGHGHGYALGGPITEPIMGIGASGRQYTFGEHGAEWVTPGGMAPGGPGLESRLDALIALNRRLISAVERGAAATGKAVGDSLNGASRKAFYGSQYQTGGA